MAGFAMLVLSLSHAQDRTQHRIKELEEQKAMVRNEEKEALKAEVQAINERLEDGTLSIEEASRLKEAAARNRALNIENRIAIIENKIALLERNPDNREGVAQLTISDDGNKVHFIFGDEHWEFFKRHHRTPKYDRRTYSDPVIAIGLNNALIEGQSLNDSPYKTGGSRFFEMGWTWRTRVFKNTNFLRFHYGFSFQFNGLKPKDNQYFVANGDQTVLEEFDYQLQKSKFRMDNLVFPVHFEFGPSKVTRTEAKLRYSLHNQFRLGIGAYGGFNMSARQKLKYDRDGDRVKDKLKRGYNTNDLIYGLSAYAGVDGVLLYLKYDLNPIFSDALVDQRMISIGLRFDM